MAIKPQDTLQTILEKYPQLIPVWDIDSGNNAPSRLVLLSREMPVDGGFSDHLFVDQHGILNFVTTTLLHNPESIHEATGRIIAYAANAYEQWGERKAKQRAIDFWNTQGKNIDDVIIEEFGTEGFDTDTFWSAIEENIRTGTLRLIIATVEPRPEVRRVIEYLNKVMPNPKILVGELKFYGINSQDLTFEPCLIGQTQSVLNKQDHIKTKWTVDMLKKAYAAYENKNLGMQLQKVLVWASAKGIFMQAAAYNPTFGLQGKSSYRIFSFFADGSLYCFFNEKHYPGEASERNLLIEQFKAVQLLDYSYDTADVSTGQILAKKLQEISDEELDQLQNILIKYCI
jgi:hypothetical protein